MESLARALRRRKSLASAPQYSRRRKAELAATSPVPLQVGQGKSRVLPRFMLTVTIFFPLHPPQVAVCSLAMARV
jgi:hypothetical protein